MAGMLLPPRLFRQTWLARAARSRRHRSLPPSQRVPGSAKAAAAAAAAFAAVGAGGVGLAVACKESSRLEPWQKRWDTGQTGWHIEEAHPILKRFLGELLPQAPTGDGMGPRVLFPLCGKTVDMPFLASKGYRVVGVEGVEHAIQELAKAHGSTGQSVPIKLPPPLAEHYRGHAILVRNTEGTSAPLQPPVLVIEGDFFGIGQAEARALVPFNAAFDRGSLVAVAPPERTRYVQVLSDMIAPGGRVLLVTVEHDAFADGRLGPPYEVSEADVHALFNRSFDVKFLQREDTLEKDPGMKARGCTYFHQCSYLLIRRGSASL